MAQARTGLSRLPCTNDVWLFIAGAILGSSFFFIVMGLPLGLASMVAESLQLPGWLLQAVVITGGGAVAGAAGNLSARWGFQAALIYGAALPALVQPLLYATRADSTGLWLIAASMAFGASLLLGYWLRARRSAIAGAGRAEQARQPDAP